MRECSGLKSVCLGSPRADAKMRLDSQGIYWGDTMRGNEEGSDEGLESHAMHV